MMRLRHCIALFVFFSMFPVFAVGQSGNASVSGTVRDSSGAVVPGVRVTVTNVDTGVAVTTSTTAVGLYAVPNVIPGSYTVDVSAEGFQRKQVSGIRLAVDQKATVDVTLEVGSTTQEVIVTSAPPPLQTEDASVGTVIGGQEVRDLPLNGRYFTQLLELAPGAVPAIRSLNWVAGGNPQLAGFQRNGMPVFDVNGGNGGNTGFRVDGIDNGEREFGGANIPVSVDAIQEVKVQTANFSAEYGRAPAQVDVVVKSGTNQIHGSLFEFFRNTALDATSWTFTGAHHGDLLHRNQFGGTLGGPIKKDKVFYFFNFDGTREVQSQPMTLTVPSNDMRNGIFPSGVIIFDPITQQPFPNNTIPSQRFDDRSKKILSVLPAPNLPGVTPLNTAGLALDPIQNYFYVPRRRRTINQVNLRVDYAASTEDNLAFRYTHSSNFLVGDGPLATNLQGSIVGFERANLGGQNLSGNWYHNLSPHTINELRVGFSTDPQSYQKGDTTDYAGQFGLSQFLFPNAFNGLPHFRIGGVNLGSGDYRPLQYGDHHYQVVEGMTLIRGAHQMRIGGELERTSLLTADNEISTGRFYFNGAQTQDRAFSNGTTPCPGNPGVTCSSGDAMADFLLGYLSHFEAGSPLQPHHRYFSSWAGYINDTWRLRPSLTLSLGLRYEYTTRLHNAPPLFAMPYVKNGVFQGVIGVAGSGGKISPLVLPEALAQIPGAVAPCSSIGLPLETCLISDKKDWQPRVGLAWSLGKKTVVRAASGIFYERIYGALDTEDGENWPFTQSTSTPTFTRPPSGAAPPPLLLSNPRALSTAVTPFFYLASFPGRKVPSSYQWNLTVERVVAQDLTASVAYVGQLGRHIEDTTAFCCPYNIPQPFGVVLGPGQVQAPADPRFGPIYFSEDENTNEYQSFQAHLARRWKNGLTFSASYTWSKNLGIYNWRGDPRAPTRGPDNGDLRHNFVVASVWQLPFGPERRWANGRGLVGQIVGGWQLSPILTLRSGFPFTPTLNGTDLLRLNGFNGASDFPDRVCSGGLDHPTLFNWFDKSCFKVPVEPTTPGALLRQGNSGLNILRGPGAFGLDMGISRSVPIRESTSVEFRTEFFNLLNHPTFGLPASGIAPSGQNSPAVISTTSNLPRIIQLAMKFTF